MKATATKLIDVVVRWLFSLACLFVIQTALLSSAMATTKRNDWSNLCSIEPGKERPSSSAGSFHGVGPTWDAADEVLFSTQSGSRQATRREDGRPLTDLGPGFPTNLEHHASQSFSPPLERARTSESGKSVCSRWACGRSVEVRLPGLNYLVGAHAAGGSLSIVSISFQLRCDRGWRRAFRPF